MFQSTRPRGARPSSTSSPAYSMSFNPRARVGRDMRPYRNCRHLGSFNPRARVGRDPWVRSRPPINWCFNPRARVGRDGADQSATSDAQRFQSTRPRGARPARRWAWCATWAVSIHAPAWGATRLCPWRNDKCPVSIHAPAWGATVHLLFPIILHKYASLFEDVSHVCPHFRFMSVME